MFSLINKKKGFTLIELLVVISIISLLSSIILSSLNTARAKARDSQRIQGLLQIRNALALYQADHNGDFPNANASTCTKSWTAAFNTALVDTGKYISSLPVDPRNSEVTCNDPIGTGWKYFYGYYFNYPGYSWSGDNGLCWNKNILITYSTEGKVYKKDCGFTGMNSILLN